MHSGRVVMPFYRVMHTLVLPCLVLFACAHTGHETTATTTAAALYCISVHPAVEGQLLDELQSVLGDRAPTYEDLERLPYLQVCLQHTLHAHPTHTTHTQICLEIQPYSKVPGTADGVLLDDPHSLPMLTLHLSLCVAVGCGRLIVMVICVLSCVVTPHLICCRLASRRCCDCTLLSQCFPGRLQRMMCWQQDTPSAKVCVCVRRGRHGRLGQEDRVGWGREGLSWFWATFAGWTLRHAAVCCWHPVRPFSRWACPL